MHLIELSPNCSLKPRAATFFYVSVLAACLPGVIACAMKGLWLVLPFAGLELLGLAAALALSLRRGRTREYIRIDERDVVVARCRGHEQVLHRFARPWTRVRLRPAGVATWPSRLMLGAMGRTVEVGSFLTETERQRLGTRLAELLGRPASPAVDG